MAVLAALVLGAPLAAAQDPPTRDDLVLPSAGRDGPVTALEALEGVERLTGSWYVVSQVEELLLASRRVVAPDPVVVPAQEVEGFLDELLAAAGMARTRTTDGYPCLYVPGSSDAAQLAATGSPFVPEAELPAAALDPGQLVVTVLRLADVDRWWRARENRGWATRAGVTSVRHGSSLVCTGGAWAVERYAALVRGDVPTDPRARSDPWRGSVVLERGPVPEPEPVEALSDAERERMFRREGDEIVVEPGERRWVYLSDFLRGLDVQDPVLTYSSEEERELSHRLARVRPTRIAAGEVEELLVRVLTPAGFLVEPVGPESMRVLRVTWTGQRGVRTGAHLYVESSKLAAAVSEHGPRAQATTVLRVPHLDPRALVTDLRALFGEAALEGVMVGTPPLSVVISGPLERVVHWSALLSAIDAHAGRGPALREVDAGGKDARELARTLARTLAGAEGAGVEVRSAPEGRSLLVSAPPAAIDGVVERIERAVERW